MNRERLDCGGFRYRKLLRRQKATNDVLELRDSGVLALRQSSAQPLAPIVANLFVAEAIQTIIIMKNECKMCG